MIGLPKGWVQTKFTDTLDVNGGTQPPKSQFVNEPQEGYIRLLQIRDFGKKPVPTYIPDNGKRRICKKEDILIGRYGASIGRICTGMEGAFNVALARVAKPKDINSGYLKYFLQSHLFQDPLSMLSRSAQNGFNKQDLAEFNFPIAPLNEQIRIADKLDSMLAKVDAAQARLDKIPNILKRFRQSVLAAATSGELTKEWRKNKDTHKITEKYYAPKEWDLLVFEKLTDVVTSGSRGWAKYYSDQGSTFIRAQNINSDYLNLSDIAFVSLPEKAEGRRTKVENHNLLITITGANVTKAARVKDDILDAYVSQHVALVKLKKNEFSPFIELFIKAENSGRGQLLELAYGAGKPGLNLQNIKGLKIALPLIEEQKEIAFKVERLLSKADAIEKKYHRAKAKTNRLTQSILAKAFRGELVPQDENDESASVLLARIAAELTAINTKAKTKPKTKKKIKAV